MSLERVINALIDLGLSRVDAEVYVYTAKKGPQKIIDLKQALNYSKLQITKSLKTLLTTGLLKKDEKSFYAIPFEEALELLIKLEKKTKHIQESKNELLFTKEK